MSELRRRIFGVGGTPDSTPDNSRDSSPAPFQKDGADYKVVPLATLDKLKKDVKKHRPWGTKRRNAWIFVLGGVFGIVLAGFFASNTGHLERLVDMAGWKDLNLDSIRDVLPAGLIKDVQEMQVRVPLSGLFSPQG